MAQPVHQPRVDMLVTDPASGQSRRRTEYAGTVWWGEVPPPSAFRMVTVSGVQDDASMFLPDSLPYRSAAADGGILSVTTALQAVSSTSTGGSNHVLDARADWVADPRGGDLFWIQLRLVVSGQEPLAVSYRVVALCDPAGVAET